MINVNAVAICDGCGDKVEMPCTLSGTRYFTLALPEGWLELPPLTGIPNGLIYHSAKCLSAGFDKLREVATQELEEQLKKLLNDFLQ